MQVRPYWMQNLEDEDLNFIKSFILASGSLKEIAKRYEVTYPTVRVRLNKIICKIQLNEKIAEDPYINLVKQLAVDDKIDFDTTKLLITMYRNQKEEN